jgi:hypothetical protein
MLGLEQALPVHPTIEYVLYATCTLGVVGALFIMITYLTFAEIRTRFGLSLIFWLSFSNLFDCIAFFPWNVDNLLCKGQALIIHFFQVTSFFWSGYIGLSVFAVIYLDKMFDNHDLSRNMRWFHAITWTVAFITTFPPFITGHYGRNEAALEPWCSTPNSKDWARLLLYLPCALTLLLSIGIFIAVRVKLSTWDSPESKMLKTNITLYVASFVVSQLPTLINRVQNYFQPHDPLYILVLIQIILQPLQSFWNAIIFGITEPDCLEHYSLLFRNGFLKLSCWCCCCWRWKREASSDYNSSRETASLINYDYDEDGDSTIPPSLNTSLNGSFDSLNSLHVG